MKKSIKWCIGALAFLTLNACSSEDGLTPPTPQPDTKTSSYSIPLDEALSIADAMLAEIEGVMEQNPNRSPIPGTPTYDPNLPMLLFHCCWGWSNGVSNGYFNFDNNTLGGAADQYADDDPHNVASKPYIFSLDLKYFGRIKVVK